MACRLWRATFQYSGKSPVSMPSIFLGLNQLNSLMRSARGLGFFGMANTQNRTSCLG